jgi:hypothetical protein
MLLCFGSFIMMPRRARIMCDVDHRDGPGRLFGGRRRCGAEARQCGVLSANEVYCLHYVGHMHPFGGVVPYRWTWRADDLIEDVALANPWWDRGVLR